MSTVVDETETSHAVVERSQWLAARKELLEKEKRCTHMQDELARLRQHLPWVNVEKPYSFQTPCGIHPLGDLFGEKSQLLVYHFMFGPDWAQGCPSCSMIADQLNALAPHLRQRDVSLMLVSRAPLEKLQAFKTRMGWDDLFWASSAGCDFNQDFGVAFDEAEIQTGTSYNFGTQDLRIPETPGLSAFVKQAGAVYHSYSTFGRGLEGLLGVYALLDVTPNGRDETLPPYPMAWVRHHDKYPEATANPSTPGGADGSSCGCH